MRTRRGREPGGYHTIILQTTGKTRAFFAQTMSTSRSFSRFFEGEVEGESEGRSEGEVQGEVQGEGESPPISVSDRGSGPRVKCGGRGAISLKMLFGRAPSQATEDGGASFSLQDFSSELTVGAAIFSVIMDAVASIERICSNADTTNFSNHSEPGGSPTVST